MKAKYDSKAKAAWRPYEIKGDAKICFKAKDNMKLYNV